jgi:hypothetical protein
MQPNELVRTAFTPWWQIHVSNLLAHLRRAHVVIVHVHEHLRAVE